MKKQFGYLFILLLDIVLTIFLISRGEWLAGVVTALYAAFGIADICFFSTTKADYDEEDKDQDY